jgi:plastocyanin
VFNCSVEQEFLSSFDPTSSGWADSVFQRKGKKSMQKAFIPILMLFTLLTLLLLSCKIVTGPPTTGPTVHMGQTNFLQSSITLHKGETLTLHDDVNSMHIITNGSWVNGVAHPKKEPGSPSVNQTFNGAGDSSLIGPFNTAGTFHLYCTVHSGMNLTIIIT